MRNRLPIVLSATALVVAVLGVTPLGQAAYDAVAPNSVGAIELRNGAVTEVKLRGDAVTGGKVRNGSLRAVDFAAGQLPAGPAGPTGPTGPKGETGAPGALATSRIVVRWSATLKGPGFGGRIARCEKGEVAVGGGGGLTLDQGATSAVKLIDSKPTPNTAGATPTGWFASLDVIDGSTAAAYAICIAP